MEDYKGPIIDADAHLFEDWAVFNTYLPSDYREGYSVRRSGLSPEGTNPLVMGSKRITYGEEYELPDGSIPKPGSLHEWLKTLNTGEGEHQWVPKPLDSLEANARIKKLDEFGVESSIVFMGEMITLLPFIDKVDAMNVMMESYNRYLLDHWGFYREKRLLTPVVLHLDDLDWAMKELDWAIKNGARAVALPVGPFQKRSPADPMFDPFWARLNEVRGVLALHIGQATYLNSLLSEWGEPILPPVTQKSAWDWMNCMAETPVIHTLSSLIYMNFFKRFPDIRVVSAENGAEWVPSMLKRMDKMRGMARNGRWPCGQLTERPSDIFKRHVYVVPYPEDDMREIIDKCRSCAPFVMGSDYPHAEGVSAPCKFMADMEGITPDEERKVMYENGLRLLSPIVA